MITIFYGQVTIDKVVDNFLSFPESLRTLKIQVRMWEISSKYRTKQRGIRTGRDDVIKEDSTTRCKTQTNLRTQSKPAKRPRQRTQTQ